MDTKWKRFSRSRAVKAGVVILYILCFAIAGFIWGYLPARGYIKPYENYAYDSLLADNFENSSYLTQKVYRDVLSVKNSFTNNIVDTRNRLSRLGFAVQCYRGGISYGDITPSAYESNLFITKNEISGSLATKAVVNGVEDIKHFLGGDDYISIGYTPGTISNMRNYWNEMRWNMQVVHVSVLALSAVGIALIVLLCIVSGEEKDGTIKLSLLNRIPYEIWLAVLLLMVFLGCQFFLGVTSLCENMCRSNNGMTLYMILTGGMAALCAVPLAGLVVSFAVRRKNNCALRGSMICVVGMALWKLLKFLGRTIFRFMRFVKEIFTAEIYSAKTVANKLIWLDVSMIAVTVIMVILGITSITGRNVTFFFIFAFLELVAIGCFFYGRYLLIRDEALVEKQIREIYSGNYSFEPKLAERSPYAEVSAMLGEFSEQYRRGIEESVKAERMKIDLVTNVSHDLKTPLTSIIGYIELLSKEELPPEAAEHVKILQSKSERLKNIVSDVFELAKTTSGEIAVEREPLDLTKLSYQTLGEMEDKIAAAGFDVKVNICEPPVTVVSDGKRLYRVIQNILDNALKYSMKGTRIYYSLDVREDGRAYIVIKNISAYEMTFTKEEILERFTRGDKARSSEGSGLGLSIAQGFTLACGGQFDIDIDGDMFKAIISFPVAVVKTEKEAVTANE
ncbi:MAG: HAMP domain-containing histidine kinase [Oscillospiraceae bacterium]|nr:HAMP domain-containing histidine kinase [Oscillospiraceae bacterium]